MAKPGRPKSDGIPYPVKPYLTIEQSNWLDCQHNKSQSITNLIQSEIDMRPMTLITYTIDGQRQLQSESIHNLIPQLKIPVGVETATVVDRSITAPRPLYAAPCSVGSDGVHYNLDGSVKQPTSYVQVIKFTVDRVSECLTSLGNQRTTVHSFSIETNRIEDLMSLV